MKLRRVPVFEPLDRPRLGEHQEREAQDAVPLHRKLVSVMSGATGFSQTKSAHAGQTAGRTTQGDRTP
jgi:hypothetical protein